MKPERRKISPHEPDQLIAGIVEAIQDSEEMLRVWEKRKQGTSECNDESAKEEATIDAQTALRELCTGIFESEENLAGNHDFFLYGAPQRKGGIH